MTRDGAAHPEKPTPMYLALRTVLAIQGCAHSHGSRPPARRPCPHHVRYGAAWANVLASHVPELVAAIAAGLGGMPALQEYLAGLAPEFLPLVQRTVPQERPG